MSIDIETRISERRLAANRANAQLSTGPRTAEGKAASSLNAVKTGLTGRTLVFADPEDARQYQAHVERVYARWQPEGDREHTLVQALADTQWRLNRIPGLESGLYALGQLRGVDLFPEADREVQKILLSAQTEVAEARALKNLHLQESRLNRQYSRAEAELQRLQEERRWERIRRQAQREEQEAAQRRRERAQPRAERKKARETAASPKAKPAASSNGFEFSTPVGATRLQTEPLNRAQTS